MRDEYNIYCDESCHLLNDKSNVMVLGAVWCPKTKRESIFNRVREIKQKYHLAKDFEIKWHKVSKSRQDFYLDIINFFFDDDDLHFRAIVVPDKSKLREENELHDHDSFYYNIYFNLLKVILSPECTYNIYLDFKDTKSIERVRHLKEILRNNQYDFQKKIVKRVQQVNSKEVEALQLTDLLIGAIAYNHRDLFSNQGKLALIEKIKNRSGYNLKQSTLYKEEKTNIFIWHPTKTV